MKRMAFIIILCYFIFYSDNNGLYKNSFNIEKQITAPHGLSDTGEKFCFVKGTHVLMADGTSKPIEQIIPGDRILSIDITGMKIEEDIVEKVDSAMHNNFVRIVFDDLTTNVNTDDHLYYIKGKGWCSVNPESTFREYKIRTGNLKPGDDCYRIQNGKLINVRISTIQSIPGKQQGYNIKLQKNANFFAGGKLVSSSDFGKTRKKEKN